MLAYLRRTIDHIALRDRSYSFLFERLVTDEAVSLDCETTGFDTHVDDIVSVAAIHIAGQRILTSEAYRAVVRPEAVMGADSIKVHRLRLKDVEHARPIEEVLPELLHFIGSRPIVGYWIAFDVRMLNKHLLRMLNIRLPNPQIDVCTLYYDRKYGTAPPGMQLDLRYDAILADLNLPKLQAHDAFNDALGAAEMYVILNDMRLRGARIPRGRDDSAWGIPVGT